MGRLPFDQASTSMELWRIASLSLLLASANSFVLPLTPTSNPTPSLAAAVALSKRSGAAARAGLGNSAGRTVCGSVRLPRTAGRHAVRSVLGRTNAAEEDGDNFGEDDDGFSRMDGPQRLHRDDDDDSIDRKQQQVAPAAHPIGDLDALDDLLGLHKSASPSSSSSASSSSSSSSTSSSEGQQDADIDDALGSLDALDDLLRRDVGMQSSPAASANGALADDGFGALDNLLGLDDGPRVTPSAAGGSNPAPIPTVGDSSSGGGGGSFGDKKPRATLGGTGSLDDLLSKNLPSAPEPTAAAAPSSSMSGGAVSSSWLDDVLNMDNDDTSGGSAGSGVGGGKGRSRLRKREGTLASLLDGTLPDAAKSNTAAAPKTTKPDAAAETKQPRSPLPEDAAAEASDTLDDWLNDLLAEDQTDVVTDAAAPNADGSQPSTSDRSWSWPAGSGPDEDSWDVGGGAGGRDSSRGSSAAGKFGADSGHSGGSGGGGGYDGVITGSNILEGWKSNMDAPRSNVMGRAGRGTPQAPSAGRGRGMQQPGFQERGGRGQGQGRGGGEQGYSRGVEWGEGAGWQSDRGGEDGGWGGQEGDIGGGGGGRVFDATEQAQRAVTADLVALGKRGEWEDAVRALVGARVRGVPVNEFMYNR